MILRTNFINIIHPNVIFVCKMDKKNSNNKIIFIFNLNISGKYLNVIDCQLTLYRYLLINAQ